MQPTGMACRRLCEGGWTIGESRRTCCHTVVELGPGCDVCRCATAGRMLHISALLSDRSHACSAIIKAAQQVRQIVMMKATNTALSLTWSKVDLGKKQSMDAFAHLSMREVKVDCRILLLGQAPSQAQRGEGHRLCRQGLHGPCAWP